MIRCVLGLGNPGTRYRSTRHNIGFRVLDALAARKGLDFRTEGELGTRALTAVLAGPAGPLVLAKPRNYMNRSGRAAVALCRDLGLEPPAILVVHDDADLELGRLRIRQGGSAGGHNGVRSIIEALQSEDFTRLKLGVRGAGRGEQDLSEYVLESFEAGELHVAEALVDLGVEALEHVLSDGLTEAMNRYNGRRASLSDPQPG